MAQETRRGRLRDSGKWLYFISAEEADKISWSPPPSGGGAGWFSPERFGCHARGQASAKTIDRLLSELIPALDGECPANGDWREASLAGAPAGFAAFAIGVQPDRFFYEQDPLILLAPAIKGDQPPTEKVSCRVEEPMMAAELPEEIAFDLEAFAAMREGRLRILSDIRPGACVLRGGRALPEPRDFLSENVCMVISSDGIACSAGAAAMINLSLEEMGLRGPRDRWPSAKEVARVARQWDKRNAGGPLQGAAVPCDGPAGEGPLFVCSARVNWDSVTKASKLSTRSAMEAIKWAQMLAGRDAEIRLESETGPMLLARRWRWADGPAANGLAPSPAKMSAQDLAERKPVAAEADVTLGACEAFDQAWGALSAGSRAPAADPPGNIKRRVVGPG